MVPPKPTEAQRALLRQAAIGPVPWYQRPSLNTVRGCVRHGWMRWDGRFATSAYITGAGRANSPKEQ